MNRLLHFGAGISLSLLLVGGCAVSGNESADRSARQWICNSCAQSGPCTAPSDATAGKNAHRRENPGHDVRVYNCYASDADVARESRRQAQKVSPTELGKVSEIVRACCSSPVPQGFIKVDDQWDPTTCGNPTSIIYNICIFERYSNKPVGSVMTVCASAPTPQGWVDVDRFWRPNMCGHPSSIQNNVKQIKRVN